ncbi:MAG: type II toxin-antitoxin system prevent-host-death family antitoxin [Dehalococcoidia bacterium]|nr:type II toxin-antitoxin system prevent-host-death family antitoxin [Dehalococcoidia bacterium]
MESETVGLYEAKTHLSHLVDEVVQGKTFTITRHGVPVAVLCPPGRVRRTSSEAVAALLKFREAHPLNGITIQELIDESRSGH